MSNDVIITVKVRNETDYAPIKAALKDIGSIGEQAGARVGKIGDSATQVTSKLGALGRQLVALKLPPIDLDVSPRKALKSIEDVRQKLTKLSRDAPTAQVKMDVEKAFSGLKKLEKGLGDVSQTGTFVERVLGNISSAITSGLETAASAAQAALSNLASGAVNLVISALAYLAGMIPLVLAGFAALAPALLIAGGAAGAAATGFAAAGIGLATLMIGFGGIGDALTAHTKQMSGAGKAAKNTAEDHYQAAKRIHDAERSLVDAKNNEKDAAKAVNQARADEIDRLRELDLALRGQKISQAEAAQALIEAKEKARRANLAGSEWEKAEANNAVARAQLQYDSVTEKLGDLTAEKKKADKDGVNGSDQVQNALKRQASAHEQVLRAQEQLADAHHKTAVAAAGAAGGINQFDQAMKKLSPNAQKLVYALLDIEKRFDAIKKRVQDRLLAGFDKSVTDLADKWLPHLDDILGSTADHLNSFGKKLMTALGDNEFIKNITTAGKEGNKVIDKMSDATDALVDAFGRLAGHSGPVLQVIADAIKGIFVWFDKWIKSADKSGKLDSFMQTAADTLHKIFDIGGKVFKVVGQFIAIIFPDSKKAGDSVLDGVSNALDKVSKWLADPKHQRMIKDIADGAAKLVDFVVTVAIPVILWLSMKMALATAGTINAIKSIIKFFTNLWHGIRDAWNYAWDHTSKFFKKVGDAGSKLGHGLSGIWNGLKDGFRNVVNWIIDRWNSLGFTIGGGSFLGVDIPSAHFATSQIKHFAAGGIGGGLAMVGERGRELVRLPQGSSVIPNGTTESMLGQGGGASRIMLGFERNSGSRLMDAIVDGLQTYVHARGGNVQVALGRHGA